MSPISGRENRVGVGIDFGTTKSYVTAIDFDTKRFKSITTMGTAPPIPTLIHAAQKRATEDMRRPWDYTIGKDVFLRSGEGFVPNLKARLLRAARHDGELPPLTVLTSAMLRKLYGRVAQHQLRPENITITIPADIGMDSRAALMYAARLAGFSTNNISLLEEPLAAFLAFYDEFLEGRSDRTALNNKKVLVIDFGGGTCDIASIAVFGDGRQPVVSRKASDNGLGGQLVTQKLLDYVLGSDYRLHPDALETDKYNYFDRAERWKEETANQFWRGGGDIREFLLWSHQDRLRTMYERIDISPVHLKPLEDASRPGVKTAQNFQIDGEKFDFVVRDTIQDRLWALLNQFRDEAREYAFVLLVGGSAQLPQVIIEVFEWLKQNKVKDAHHKIWFSMDSASYISRGAALYQYYLAEQKVAPVNPLLDRSLSVATRPDIWLATHSFSALEKAKGLDVLINKGQYLPFPGTYEGNVAPAKAEVFDSVDAEGQPVRAVRRTYQLDRTSQEDMPDSINLLLFDGDKKLGDRVIHLRENDSARIIIDFWIDRWGILTIKPDCQGCPPDSQPFIVYAYNIQDQKAINETIYKYSLDFPLNS